MSEKLIQYLRAIADWADPHPELSHEMLIHEMGRIRRQAFACIRMVEQTNEVMRDGGSSRDTSTAPSAEQFAQH